MVEAWNCPEEKCMKVVNEENSYLREIAINSHLKEHEGKLNSTSRKSKREGRSDKDSGRVGDAIGDFLDGIFDAFD